MEERTRWAPHYLKWKLEPFSIRRFSAKWKIAIDGLCTDIWTTSKEPTVGPAASELWANTRRLGVYEAQYRKVRYS